MHESELLLRPLQGAFLIPPVLPVVLIPHDIALHGLYSELHHLIQASGLTDPEERICELSVSRSGFAPLHDLSDPTVCLHGRLLLPRRGIVCFSIPFYSEQSCSRGSRGGQQELTRSLDEWLRTRLSQNIMITLLYLLSSLCLRTREQSNEPAALLGGQARHKVSEGIGGRSGDGFRVAGGNSGANFGETRGRGSHNSF